MPLEHTQRQIAAKVEGTEGTAETLALADAIRVVEAGFEPTIDLIPLDYLGSSKSGKASLRGKREGKITCKLPIKGSGVLDTAPEYGTLLKGCGMSETTDAGVDIEYLPISTAEPALTLGRYLDGKLNRIWGARGNFKIICEAGQPGWFEFDFMGADFDDADGAMLVPVYDATVPPICLGITFTIGGFAFKINKIELDFGATLSQRDDIAKSSGNFSVITGRRRGIGSMDPELSLKAVKDIYGEWRSGAEGALVITLGSTLYNIIQITAPKVAITNIADEERGELAVLGVDLELNENAGNDELVINYPQA